MGGLIKPNNNIMNKYIGTKLVKAEAMTYGVAYNVGLISPVAFVKELSKDEGYQVTYEDGYVSWSPKETFESTYRPCDGMNFGLAIEALKKGHKVARRGWNGRNMFLWLKPAATVKAEWCKDPKLKALAEENGGKIEALGTICMFTAQKQILSGWLASQTDMLAEDWVVVE